MATLWVSGYSERGTSGLFGSVVGCVGCLVPLPRFVWLRCLNGFEGRNTFCYGLDFFVTDYFPSFSSTRSFFCCLCSLPRRVSESRCVIRV